MHRTLGVILATIVAASAASAQPAAPAKPSKAQPVLKLARLTMELGPSEKIIVAPDGRMQIVRDAGRLSPNGELLDRHGQVKGRVRADGTVLDAQGKQLFKLVGDGAVEVTAQGKTKRLVVKADGTGEGEGKALDGLKVVGARSPAARRLAALLLALHLTVEEPSPPSVSVAPAVPAVPPKRHGDPGQPPGKQPPAARR